LILRLDTLSAFFGIVINGGAGRPASTAWASTGPRNDARIEPLFPLFAAAMNLVLIADDAYAFLFSWELMSLASGRWSLPATPIRSAGARLISHLVMAAIAHRGVAVRLRRSPAGRPAAMPSTPRRRHPPQPMVAALVLTAALIGCGSKSGLIPLHAWLPLAHPAAPSHVSALMSGVMTKVAIYASCASPSTCSAARLVVGTAAHILGAMTAVLGLLCRARPATSSASWPIRRSRMSA
jgi:formate hydrogenlyase subunit 3/multisubunit Na+/H+ antiporter MnhD subunit